MIYTLLSKSCKFRQFFHENKQLVETFLNSEDAKTRKNMALLLGDLEESENAELLYLALSNITQEINDGYLINETAYKKELNIK